MSKCPYPELIVDECSGIVLENPMFNIWHQGYEARKLETMKGDIAKQKNLTIK
jgi:hypothetical protein